MSLATQVYIDTNMVCNNVPTIRPPHVTTPIHSLYNHHIRTYVRITVAAVKCGVTLGGMNFHALDGVSCELCHLFFC